MSSTEEKYSRLQQIVAQMDSVLVAYSGGVDSTFLLKVCCDVLEGRVLAVTAISPTYPSQEMTAASEMARSLSASHQIVDTNELKNPDFAANPPERCYHCKRELFTELTRIAEEQKISKVIDGSNFDDLDDHRPGARAASELGVLGPLQEAQLTKEEVRALSKKLGLPTWNKPSLACLASRFPYGSPITEESLTVVNDAEVFLHSLGIGQLRLRHHGKTARIEVEPQDMRLLLENPNRQRVLTRLKELGYLYITLDLAGYRTGSMNEELFL